MRKLNKGRKFGRTSALRKALLKSLAQNLFIHGRIRTTEAKAKELRSTAEKMITRAKIGDLNARRLLARQLSGPVVKKLVEEIAPTFKERKGGYTRVIKLGQRTTDGAEMAIIELVK